MRKEEEAEVQNIRKEEEAETKKKIDAWECISQTPGTLREEGILMRFRPGDTEVQVTTCPTVEHLD